MGCDFMFTYSSDSFVLDWELIFLKNTRSNPVFIQPAEYDWLRHREDTFNVLCAIQLTIYIFDHRPQLLLQFWLVLKYKHIYICFNIIYSSLSNKKHHQIITKNNKRHKNCYSIRFGLYRLYNQFCCGLSRQQHSLG